MKIDFLFKQIESSEAFMEYATDQLMGVSAFENRPMDVKVTVFLDGHDCWVEARCAEGKRRYHASAASTDFYRSMDLCVERLNSQMSKIKRRMRSHRRFEKSHEGKLLLLSPDMTSDFKRLDKRGEPRPNKTAGRRTGRNHRRAA